MESRTLKRVGLLWALVCMSLVGLQAANGRNLGNFFGWNATPTSNTVLTGQYYASTTYDYISFEGNITVSATAILGANSSSVLTVSFGTTNQSITRFFPQDQSYGVSTASANYGHLIFHTTDTSAKIICYVEADLIFTGSTSRGNGGYGGGATWAATDTLGNDMVVTFSGQGQTIFRIANGHTIKFTSQTRNRAFAATPAATEFVDNTTTGSAGCLVLVTMDQSKDQAVTQGVNKLVFSRYNYSNGSDTTATTGTNQTCKVYVGPMSVFTFVSTASTGLDLEPTFSGYGAVAFDVSNAGFGRTVLHIAGGAGYDYSDGAFLINGHLVTSKYSTDNVGTYTLESDVRLVSKGDKHQTNGWSQLAGRQAIVRVIDDLAYANTAYAAGLATSSVSGTAAPSRRSLLIINECATISPLMANTYSDTGLFFQQPLTNGLGRRSNRVGFILGGNGMLELGHNTFVDYVATKTGWQILPTGLGLSGLNTMVSGLTNTAQAFFLHSPSALVVDGNWKYNTKYLADQLQYDQRHAIIQLRGDSRLYLSAGKTAAGAYGTGAGTSEYLAPYTSAVEYVYSFTIGSALFDGFRVNSTNYTFSSGVPVMDVQSWLTIKGIDDEYTRPSGASSFARHNGSDVAAAGVVEPINIKRDAAGREVINDLNQAASFVTRPLNTTSTFAFMNRPCIEMNARVEVDDATLNITDAAHRVVMSSTASEPVIIGGELAEFNYWTNMDTLGTASDMPVLALINGTLGVHTDCSMSGVHLVVADDLTTSTTGSNSSSIMMYNHGNALDKTLRGMARVLELGTDLNNVAIEGPTGLASARTKSAHINVYRASAASDKTVSLALQSPAEFPSGVSSSQKNAQVVFLGNYSNIDLGWTDTVGFSNISTNTRAYPWTSQSTSATYTTLSSFQFGLNTASNSAAELVVDGDRFFISGNALTTLTTYTTQRVVYANTGGKLSINTGNYAFFDAAVGIRTDLANYQGQVSLPVDQVGQSVPSQLYNIDLSVLTNPTTPYLALDQFGTAGPDSIMYLPWYNITMSGTFAAVKSFGPGLTRAADTVTGPVTLPSVGLLEVTAGTKLEQLVIQGASPMNPLSLYVTGDSTGFGEIREMTGELVDFSGSDIIGNQSQGQFASIFMDQGATVGFGSRHINAAVTPGSSALSNGARFVWSLLGQNNVTLYPNGDCTVVINQSIALNDGGAVVPTSNFGASETNRITFRSDVPREIRVKSGTTFDLGGFINDSSGANQQQIAFAGKVSLVIEAGADIRFPTGITAANAPVLYFTEEASLVFEGVKDRDNKAAWTALADQSYAKSRIMGVGQIWLNKNASLKCFDEAIVGVEANASTLTTDLTISAQRQSQILIGDVNNVGGTFLVGNPTDVTDATINFTLKLNGPQVLAYFGRQSVFGLGAGILDVSGGTLNNWKLVSLFNVNDVEIDHTLGTLAHNQIFDGTSSECSLWAIGPVAGTYTVNRAVAANAIIRGGGNLIYVTTDATEDAPLTPSVLAAATVTSPDNGTYTLMASAPMLGSRGSADGVTQGTTDDNVFAGTQAQLYGYLGMLGFADMPSKYVAFSSYKGGQLGGYLDGTTINRVSIAGLLGASGTRADMTDSLSRGTARAVGASTPEYYVSLQ